MQTKLFLKGLEVYAYHGLFQEENVLGQKFVFDVECRVDYKKAMLSDDMKDSISYANIAEEIVKVSKEKNYNLLEKLAGEVIKTLFSSFQEIDEISLKIDKPMAPIPYSFKGCGVNIKINRKEFLELF